LDEAQLFDKYLFLPSLDIYDSQKNLDDFFEACDHCLDESNCAADIFFAKTFEA